MKMTVLCITEVVMYVCVEEMKLIFLGQVRSTISKNLSVVVNLILSIYIFVVI